MLGASTSLIRLSPLIGSITGYLIWGAGALLAIAALVAIVIWRGKQRWPILAAIAKHPFSKYIAASVVAHLLLVIWLLNASLFKPPPEPGPPPIMVSFDDGPEFGSPQQQPFNVASVVPAVDPPEQELTTQATQEAVERPSLPVPVSEPADNELPLPQFAETSLNSDPINALAPTRIAEANSRENVQTNPLAQIPATEAVARREPEMVQPPVGLPAEVDSPRPFAPEPDTHALANRFSDQATLPTNVQQPMESPEPHLNVTDSRPADSNVVDLPKNEFVMPRNTELTDTVSPQELPDDLTVTPTAKLTQPTSSFSQNADQQQQAFDEQPTRRSQDSLSEREVDQRERTENGPSFSSAIAEPVQTATLQNIRAIEDPRSTNEPFRSSSVPTESSKLPNPLRNSVGYESDNRSTSSPVAAGQTQTKLISSTKSSAATSNIPPLYHDRLAANRLAIAKSRGGSINTERAVQAALHWLANAQSANGGWDASQFGSGRPTFEGGHDRRGAGQNADAGVTGLAVLAFLGSGDTHQAGNYATNVRRALNYLLSIQQRNGSLSGNAQVYAAMYCHGIATLAISEAYSLTGDPELLPAVQNAIRYTLSMQHPTSGGWRYRDWRQYPGQEGDTSQLGWQMMALTSAHYAGLQIPGEAWIGASRFLDGVTSRDGRASYRPRQLPSPAMTAEAMLCRLFLRVPPNDPQIRSGARYLLSRSPRQGRTNYYYWYYGTLALYHLQDENWQRWNTAVKRTLVGRQQGDGSWSADSVWGTSGGKVYSTALGALTLEVYYRYRPLAKPTATSPTSTTPFDKTANRNAPHQERGAEHTAWKRN